MIQGQLPLSFSPGLLSSGATGLGSLGSSSLLSTSGVNSFTGSLGGGLGSSLGLGGMGLGTTSGLGGTSSLMGLGTSGLGGMSALGGLSAGGLMGTGAAGGTPNALGGYGGGYGGSAGAGSQGSGDFTQQIFSIISSMLQLLTALLPQLLGGGTQQPGGEYNPGNPYKPTDPGQGNGNGAQPPVIPEGPGKPIGGLTPGQGTKLGPNPPSSLKSFQPEIEKASAASGVPASVLGAMIWQESRGNLQALSTNGGNGLTDTGLMQVNPNTYKELQTKYPELQGRDNLSDPETNILAGAFYMKDMIAQFGDIPTALRAYNSGPNGVDRNNLNALPAGTGDATYVDKVLSFANSLTQGGALPP